MHCEGRVRQDMNGRRGWLHTGHRCGKQGNRTAPHPPWLPAPWRCPVPGQWQRASCPPPPAPAASGGEERGSCGGRQAGGHKGGSRCVVSACGVGDPTHPAHEWGRNKHVSNFQPTTSSCTSHTSLHLDTLHAPPTPPPRTLHTCTRLGGTARPAAQPGGTLRPGPPPRHAARRLRRRRASLDSTAAARPACVCVQCAAGGAGGAAAWA